MRAFHLTRNALDDGLGQPPGAELHAAYHAILHHRVAPAPPPRRRRTLDDRYDDIVRAALGSQLVPVLGPHVGGSEAAIDPGAAAEHLSRRFACPPEYDGSLTRVSQWVAVTHGIGPLYDELHALYERDVPPGPVHRRSLRWRRSCGSRVRSSAPPDVRVRRMLGAGVRRHR